MRANDTDCSVPDGEYIRIVVDTKEEVRKELFRKLNAILRNIDESH